MWEQNFPGSLRLAKVPLRLRLSTSVSRLAGIVVDMDVLDNVSGKVMEVRHVSHV